MLNRHPRLAAVTKTYLLWQAHQVYIGISYGDVFGKGAPSREAWLELAVTDLMISREALWTCSTATHEGQCHPVAPVPAGNVPSRLNGRAGQLVARHVRKCGDIRIVP